MKFKIINILFIFLLLCNCQSSQCQNKNKSSFEWATFTLPTTVGQLITGLGNYTKFKPCPNVDECEFGSTYEWKSGSGLVIDAFAMKVGPKSVPSKQHAIEIVELSAGNGAVVENLIFQLALNKSSLAECRKKLDLKKSTRPNTWKFEGSNVYTYLTFDDKGILIKIGQYSFDLDSVG